LARDKTFKYLDSVLFDSRIDRGDDSSGFAVRTFMAKSELLIDKLKDAVDGHFADAWLNSRAFLVVYASQYPAEILVERFGDGFTASIPKPLVHDKVRNEHVYRSFAQLTHQNHFPGLETEVHLLNLSHLVTAEEMSACDTGWTLTRFRRAPITDHVVMLFEKDTAAEPTTLSPVRQVFSLLFQTRKFPT
jgi:hypothetical protein